MSRMNLMEESRGTQVEGFCMVKSCAVRTDSKGASYMDMTVADAGGECAAKLWNYNIAAYGTFDPEDVVKIRATINIWKDVEQLKVERIRLATPEDNVDMSRLVPCAPGDPQKYFDYLWNLSDEFTDKDLKKLVQYFLDAFRQEILRFPAGVKLHHATRGGWLQHTCAVVRMGRAICQLYPALDRDLVTAGATLHDIGKLKLTGYINGQERDPLLIEELKYVRMHSSLGYEELKEQGYSDIVLQSILYHHENYDGSGYPSNLSGDSIPLGARILRVCDVYAALSSDRPYRKAFDVSTVIELMIDEIKNFDMEVFLAFQRVVHNNE